MMMAIDVYKRQASDNVNAQTVIFDGFTDANFGKDFIVISADAKMYMGGIDYNPDCVLTKHDDTAELVSKMLFDTTTVAAFTDNQMTRRFDRWATSKELGHDYPYHYTSASLGEDHDHELQIGYKAQGSFLVDFRQGLLAAAEKTTEYEFEQYPYYRYDVKGFGNKPFNTAADLTMTQTIPAAHFDAYYIKIHPNAISYMQSIDVTYGDGSVATIDLSSYGANSGNGNSWANGKRFLRIDLLYKENGVHKPFLRTQNGSATDTDDYAYRAAFDDAVPQADRCV